MATTIRSTDSSEGTHWAVRDALIQAVRSGTLVGGPKEERGWCWAVDFCPGRGHWVAHLFSPNQPGAIRSYNLVDATGGGFLFVEM